MALRCNIDRRGRMARVITGAVCDLGGAALIVWGALAGRWGGIVAGILLSAAGGFMIFEGAVGWCAARALGIKTPM